MDILTAIVIVGIFSAGVFTWQASRRVYPAWKHCKIQESCATLAKSLSDFNESSLVNGKIHNGHYLHDNFYKFMFDVLINNARVSLSMLKDLKSDERLEKNRLKFRKEIDSLDLETKKTIDNALSAITTILFWNNPLVFLLICWKVLKQKRNYDNLKSISKIKKGLVRSTEYLTVEGSHGSQYAMEPCYATRR